MIEYTFELTSREFKGVARACCDWDVETQECEKIKIFMGNLKKDIKDWDELISGIEAMYLCETICSCISIWRRFDTLYPLCEKMKVKNVEGCPIMGFLVNELKLKYKLNMESVKHVL